MRSMMLCIVACFLFLSPALAGGTENCRVCHKLELSGIHAGLPCLSCHVSEVTTLADPAAPENRGTGCVGCHKNHQQIFGGAMATRAAERLFVERTFGRFDQGFFGKNCNSCHLKGCTDCHGAAGHRVARAADRDCFACHKGYFVGTEYYGMAPREESLRYQRGEEAYGETFLKMLPDVHAEAGLTCGSCHSMKSLAGGARASKSCTQCHKVDKGIVEHRIAAHLEKLECYACHSAWAAQEYGTFYLRFIDSPAQDSFRLVGNDGEEYVKSVYLKKQDAPPLGLNDRGRVSPIRPQFISFFTQVRNDRSFGVENALLAAEWKAFFPHTVRRGSVMCEGCHDTPRRFLLEPADQRIYQLQKDGMSLPSFWDRSGQRVVNGAFLPEARYRQMSRKGPAYQRGYLEKWKSFIDRVEDSSAP